uniref:Uncharacterized protein n=1 Tax=Panagrolaimus sp. ES5 TaxID=591445 RepID=A0AC34G3W2_9BILA
MQISDLFAAALTLGPNSSEQKDITALDLRMQKGFNQIELNIKKAKGEILFYNVLEAFDHKINYCLTPCIGETKIKIIDFLMVEWKIVIRKVLGENVLENDFHRYQTCTNGT